MAFDMDKLKDLGALGTEATEVANTVKALGENIIEKSKELFGKAENGTKEGAEDVKKDAEAFIDKAKEALAQEKKDVKEFEAHAKATLRDDKKAIREFADRAADDH